MPKEEILYKIKIYTTLRKRPFVYYQETSGLPLENIKNTLNTTVDNDEYVTLGSITIKVCNIKYITIKII